MSGLPIGQVAKAADVSVETVRYYQRRGLLAAPDKPIHGHRSYPPGTVRTLKFIKRAQTLGFTLAEIGALVQISEEDVCNRARRIALDKVELIDRRVEELKSMRAELLRLTKQCAAPKRAGSCPIIESLYAD